MRIHQRVIPSAARDLLFNRGPIALCMIELVAVLSLIAQAQERVPLARRNTPGEPHHHLNIENEYVRVYYVEVSPHESTQLHQHDHDYIYVSLGPSEVVNAILNKPEIHLQLKDGETHFTRGGFAHVALNLADTPFRNITIELLKPQGEPTNLCAQIVPNAPSAGCSKSLATSQGELSFSVEPQMETPEIGLDLVRMDPETKGPAYALPWKTLVVVLNDCEVQLNVNGQMRTLQGGEVSWIQAGTPRAARNPTGKPASFLQLAMKDAGAKP